MNLDLRSNSVDTRRVTRLNNKHLVGSGECVIYWMQKDQRADDNWALIRSVELANALKLPLYVVFIVTDKIKNNYDRHYQFMLEGIAETATSIREKGIGFGLYIGNSENIIVEIATKLKAAAIITDLSHLLFGKSRRAAVAGVWGGYMEAVEASLIVPVGVAADKAVYGAYLMRPRIKKVIADYLTDYPDIAVRYKWEKAIGDTRDEQDVGTLLLQLKLQSTPKLVQSARPGSKAAAQILRSLLEGGLESYAMRSDPNNLDAPSGLSPYLHYGQISSQRIIFDLYNSPLVQTASEQLGLFYDQVVVWRELCANFVEHNPHYAGIAGAPDWARQTLLAHETDEREFIYSSEEFEAASTHDKLWNAAQLEMVKTGRMHNYLRMYWAKKILEWTPDASEAVRIAVYLNDKYNLDGRDPNGYCGILWAIAGLHDRPWFEREVYGMVRYMNANGAAKKFNTEEYIRRMEAL